jgi:hypothetical protein
LGRNKRVFVKNSDAELTFRTRFWSTKPRRPSGIFPSKKMTNNSAFAWPTPSLAHFQGPLKRIVPHILRWLRCCANGTQDRRSLFYDMVFVDGESVAQPAMLSGGGR